MDYLMAATFASAATVFWYVHESKKQMKLFVQKTVELSECNKNIIEAALGTIRLQQEKLEYTEGLVVRILKALGADDAPGLSNEEFMRKHDPGKKDGK